MVWIVGTLALIPIHFAIRVYSQDLARFAIVTLFLLVLVIGIQVWPDKWLFWSRSTIIVSYSEYRPFRVLRGGRKRTGTTQIANNDVIEIEVKQSEFQRWLGIGDIIVKFAKGAASVSDIENPQEAAKTLRSLAHRANPKTRG